MNKLANRFPERAGTGIDCTAMIWGLYLLYCMNPQESQR
jgi:hypothetical protein